MKLTLIIKEEKKIFNLPEFIPARLIRQAPELADIPNNPYLRIWIKWFNM